MTKKTLKLLVLIVAFIALFIALVVWASNIPAKEENKSDLTLWQLVDQMDSLRDLKNECANNLGIADSAKFLQGYTWYCDSWDAEIIELRTQINKLQKKDYEGLVQSR